MQINAMQINADQTMQTYFCYANSNINLLHLEVCHKNRLKILLDGEVSQIVYYYDPQGFKILNKISSGASILVYNVCWKDTSRFVIKKFIGNSNEKAIINEIHLTGLVNLHPNIIQFYGVTKLNDEINYSLVLEYAEGGTLGKYLKDNTITFKWKSQLKFAKEISSAISWLHVDKGIIHGDLHPNNILIQKDTIKLADFGRSCLKGSDSNTEVRGVIPYMDPKFFEPQNHSYHVLTEKSDIYSLGVLLWELTS
ncbi:kinase-like protein, partial [Rhizophagus irregularis]